VNISILSTEYVKAPVAAVVNGATVDPTSDTVTVAWARPGDEPTAFSAASWETDSTTTPTTYLARRLLTAGDLAAGPWVMWVKVVHSPETIVVPAGVFTVV
jgi:hypothetical protein